jgi:hypothetical protein
MFTKLILSALLAVCGVHSSTATDKPPSDEPDAKPRDEILFCCQHIDVKAKTGNTCITIEDDEIDSCSNILTCAKGFTKKDGIVTCF